MPDWQRIDWLIDGLMDESATDQELMELTAALEADSAVQQRYARRLLLHSTLKRHAACIEVASQRRTWPRALMVASVAAAVLVALLLATNDDAPPQKTRTITITLSQDDGSQTRLLVRGLRQIQTHSMRIPLKEKRS